VFSRKKLIVICGMPGAGKGVASEPGRKQGLPILVFGDVVREETEKRGLDPTPQNTGDVMLKIRKEEGPAVIAKRLCAKIDQINADLIILEGARSTEEVDQLRLHFEVTTVGVHAAPKTRFERLLKRGRSDDPRDWNEFAERDNRELAVGIGHVLALADQMLVNEGTISELQTAFARVLEKIRST
jgi:dephospho-CoA kinase